MIKTKAVSLLILLSIAVSLLFVPGKGSGRVNADTDGAAGFVTRLYEICLDREPEQGGLDNWVSNLTSGRITGSEAARGFIFSSEFSSHNYDNRTFVIYLYRALFGREADDAGLSAWTASLNGGDSREEVFNGFTGSDEWNSICASYGILPGNGSQPSVAPASEGIRAFISRLYSGFLGRDADPSGLSDWSSKLSSGNTTGFDAAYGFMNSPEFLRRASSMSNTALVTVFYNTFLGRNPSTTEVSSYTSRMGSNLNANLEMLFLNFVNSDEFIGFCTGNGIIPGTGNGASVISDADVTEFFNNAVLIGSSTSVGFDMYFNAYGRGIMGNVLVCARVSYSLLNDMTTRTSYIPQLNGTPMRARDIIRNSGRRYAFICLGTNDIFNGVVQRYYDYLDDIRSVNPDTVIFIEACTPSRDDHPSNRDIAALNTALRQYCSTHDGFYYVDTNTPLLDSTGRLASQYCSDGNVHITYSGYARWIETLTDAARQYIYEQRITGNYPY